MSIGENLRRMRLERNMTQREIAEAVSVSLQMISQVERGTKTLSLPLAGEIADLLDCSVEDLLRDKVE